MMHVGQGLVCGDKIQDLIRAGFEFTIFLADYHSMINNKYGGDLQKIRTTGEYFQHCFTALGVPREKVEYVWASDLADRKEYWERVLRVARTVSTQRVLRAIPIMGRDMKSKDMDAAAIFYPCMQAADIFEIHQELACGGLNQRERDLKYGGKVEVETYQQLEEAFAAGKIHPKDLKSNISRILSEKLAPVREYFRKHPKPLEEMRSLGAG